MRRLTAALASFALVAAFNCPAFAYRPFDGTDGDVAPEGEFELELGPAHYLARPEGRYLLAPATVLNFGIESGTELVVDVKDFIALDRVAGQSRMRLLDTDIFIKTVVRRGVLQGETGLSIAVEAGPLLPELGGANSYGAQANVITSYQWPALTFHLNTSAALSREHNFDGFASLILEGPHEWALRPVAELYVEREAGEARTYSALAGAIWQLREGFALDAAVRYAAQDERKAFEFRFGVTWALTMWHEEAGRK